MAQSLKCDLCTNPATVHLTQIVNNQVHKVDLCESCAQAKGVTDPSGFSIADILVKASLQPEVATSGAPRCEQCGFTQTDFKKHGRFGCPQCYATFSTLVEPMLDNMHKGTVHSGKVPQKSLQRKNFHERINKLEQSLAAAIKGELFEDAARFRDELKLLRQSAAKASVVS